MGRIYSIVIVLILSGNVFAQIPQKMSYQAVIRNSSDALVTNTTVSIQLSIIQGSSTGTVVYSETQTPVTNTNGLVSLEIGTGTTIDDFSAIDWASGTYFIKTETDPAGGTNYTITGTSQLLSVPYALHANSVANEIQGIGDVLSRGTDANNNPILNVSQQGIGILKPDTSAALEINSTSQGFLPPRMTNLEKLAIVSPVAGLLVWCSNCGTSGEIHVYNGTSWTNLIGGTTEAIFPAVATNEMSLISTTSATSGGNVTSDGGIPVTARGVCWSLAENPTVALSTKTIDSTGTGIFTSSITGLTLGTTYYVRAYAINSLGTSYGNQVSFTTLFTIPQTTENALVELNEIHKALIIRYGSQGRGGLGAHYIAADSQGEDHVYNYATWTTNYRWLASADPISAYNSFPWIMFYQWIDSANVLINGMEDAIGLQEEKDIIKGQSLIYRAFSYHRLVQTYGDRYVTGGNNSQLGVPLILENILDEIPRATVEQVYTQIHADLSEAITLLEGWSRPNKTHLNADVARAIKARVYLTQGDYANASDYANQVIASNSYSLMDFTTYALGFRLQSETQSEYIWASSHITLGFSDTFANFGAYISRNFSSSTIRANPRSISGWLYDQIPATDVRKELFDDAAGQALTLPAGITLLATHQLFPYTNEKFIAPSNSDSRVDVPHVRLSEMYLIVAEANARMGNDAAASEALYTMVVVRDPSYAVTENTGNALVEEIMIQRRVELWGEGFRWYDLKRLNMDLDRNQAGNHQVSIAVEMFIPAGDNRWTWLIPQEAIDANPSLVQNPL